ncbi:MAG: hypothetical protein ACLFVI_04950 [Archaeoglobaceae archaeon]
MFEFNLYTSGLVALFLVVIAVLVTWYFSRMEGSDEEAVLDIVQGRKKVSREELQQETGLNDEKLDRILQSLEQVTVEGEEVHYVGERWKE